MLVEQLQQYTASLRQQDLYRQRRVFDPAAITTYFSSNDYLSLSTCSEIKKAYQQGVMHYPTGSGGSMAVCGYHPIHQTLERTFAKALNVDDCLLFPSGYAANLSIMNLLARFDTQVLIDKKVHASLYDGIRSTDARYVRFLHNDMYDLALKIAKTPSNTMLVTEGLFSMSGQLAPLASMAVLSRTHLQGLIVDEAHAFGVLGEEGLGAVVHHGLSQIEVPLRVIPLGKAFAATGAIVAGQGIWIEALLQSARPYIYSTAVSPAYAYGMLHTLEVLRHADERRTKLQALIAYFRESITQSPLSWANSHSPIQQLQLGCPARALALAAHLREQGIICMPMREPTVSQQETGLRISLNYHHEPEDIDSLLRYVHA